MSPESKEAFDKFLDWFFTPTPMMRLLEKRNKLNPKPAEEYTGHDIEVPLEYGNDKKGFE